MEYDLSNYIQISGKLFNEVQQKRIFPDSKTFVDSVPKYEPKEILNKFIKNKSSTDFDLLEFIKENFALPEDDEKSLDLPDDRDVQTHINLIWNYLKRESSSNQSEYSTLIQLPHPFIIPGGRFREVYYWDSYFTMQGLLADGEIETVENMIDNFSYLIEEIGFIPNGNRIYYLSRSQPPFFAPMVDLVCRFKNDYGWGLKYLHALEREHKFWCGNYSGDSSKNHIVKLPDGKFLNRYFDSEKLPREESYLEDIQTAQNLPAIEKANLYQNIRAACESGWDFSSRWFRDEKSLSACVASDILPVDLNCLLYFAESLISKLNDLKGDKNKSQMFSQSAENRAELINKIFWDEKKKFFFDYNWKDQKRTNVYSLAACYPLYFRIASKEMAASVKEKIESDFLRYGGVLTTLNFVGQQWDAPNGWAPLQWIAIKGLRNYGFHNLADEIKSRWLKLNEDVFNRTGKMFEKYNVEDISLHAGGGEYNLQDGFGWTNGIASALLSNLDEEL